MKQALVLWVYFLPALTMHHFVQNRHDIHFKQQSLLERIVFSFNKCGEDLSKKTIIKAYIFYAALPLVLLHILVTAGLHIKKSDYAVANYCDPGHIARYAIVHNNHKLLELYLSKGFNPNFRDRYLNTLLEYTWHMKNNRMARLLVDSGADIDKAKNSYGFFEDYYKSEELLNCYLYIPSIVLKGIDCIVSLCDVHREYRAHEATEIFKTNFQAFCNGNDPMGLLQN